MLKRLSVPYVAVTAALALAGPASAQSNLDRVQVGVPGTVTRQFATSLSLAMTIPSGYTRDCCYDFVSGAWVGPAVHYSDDPGRTTLARTSWRVTFRKSSSSLASVARSAVAANFATVNQRKRTVKHVLAGHGLGTVKAYSLVGQQAGLARTQAALVVDLGRKVKAIVVYDLLSPDTDGDASGGSITVNGLAASVYNLKAAEASLASVKLEGALPIGKVKAKGAGGKVTGKVLDIAGQGVGQAKLALQKKSGGWKTIRKGKSTLTGGFSLKGVGTGQYRVVATFGKDSGKSSAVRLK
jgi:hypothetical protein